MELQPLSSSRPGTTYGSFVKDKIFDPPRLERITVFPVGDANLSSANMVLNDGSIYPIRPPSNSDGTGLAGAGGGKASLGDLLQLYNSLLSTYKAE